MKDFNNPWTSREDALRIILERSEFYPRTERIPLRESLGRITALDVIGSEPTAQQPYQQYGWDCHQVVQS